MQGEEVGDGRLQGDVSVWPGFSVFVLVIDYVYCAIPWWEVGATEKLVIAA